MYIFFGLGLRQMRENGKITDFIHDVYNGRDGLTSFPLWFVCDGGHELSLAFLFLRRGILVCIFVFPWAAEGDSFWRFRSLD